MAKLKPVYAFEEADFKNYYVRETTNGWTFSIPEEEIPPERI